MRSIITARHRWLPARVRARCNFASLAFAGSLGVLALALAAGGLGAAERQSPPTSDAAIARMLEISSAIEQMRKGGTATPRAIDRLLTEYRLLSDALGGDDPAHLLGSANPALPAGGANDGGLAGGPSAPPGCESETATFTNDTPVAIPVQPANTIHVSSTIEVSGLDPFIWDVNLTTFIRHTFAEDLDITLTSPAGTIVTITTDNGAAFDNVFNGTLWDDSANPGGQVPYTINPGLATDHPYADLTLAPALVPEEALGAFFGEDPNGTWTLTIVDDQSADGGLLEEWSLEIATVEIEPSTSLATVSNDTPVAISDNSTVSSTILVSGLDAVLTDVNVTTFITHTECQDLDITIQSPAGTIVTLTTDNGGAFDNVFNGTVWDDQANPLGSIPYASNAGLVTDRAYSNNVLASPLVPEEALAAFIGEDPNGTWTLTVHDDLATDTGMLNSWSLDLTTTSTPPATSVASFTNTTVGHIELVIVTSTLVVSGAGDYLWDLDFTAALTHSACGDFDMTLTSPSGTVVTITTDNGGFLNDVFNGTTWNDHANPGGQVPYTSNNGVTTDHAYLNATPVSSLTPEEALGAFIGENPNGEWTLTINDDNPTTDGGNLASWSLSVTSLEASPVMASPVAGANVTAVPIADTAPPNVVSSTIDIGGAGAFICDVNVTINVSHTFSGDLDITLTSPEGTVVTLTTDNGGSFDNVFAGTTFDDSANPGGQVPYGNNPGLVTDRTYANLVVAPLLAPEEPLAAFIGDDPNGTWTLTISDDTNTNGGALNSWSLEITTCECPPPSCPGDTNDSGTVDVDDLIAVILGWGPCAGCPPVTCPSDVAPFPGGNCQTDVDDLIAVILAWGPCP